MSADGIIIRVSTVRIRPSLPLKTFDCLAFRGFIFFIGAVMFFYFGNFFFYNGCSFLPLENGFFQLSDLEFPTFLFMRRAISKEDMAF
nr:MAG TPA: hypothetical protein [Caudoviricetes sp.]